MALAGTEPSVAGGGGRAVGAAVEPDLLESDAAYRATVVREFNAVTPENAMKWERIHPAEREWSFEPADRLVAFAEAHGMRVHGHTLVWHRQLAGWLTPALTLREAARALAVHVETLVGRYAGRVGSWDVVNEAVADGGGLRDTVLPPRVRGGPHRRGLPARPCGRSRRPALLQRLRRRGRRAEVERGVRAGPPAPRPGRPRPRGRPPDAPPGGPPAEARRRRRERPAAPRPGSRGPDLGDGRADPAGSAGAIPSPSSAARTTTRSRRARGCRASRA